MSDLEQQLIGALRDVLRAVEARRTLDQGFNGMGQNIVVEAAGRLGVESHRARRLLDDYDKVQK